MSLTSYRVALSRRAPPENRTQTSPLPWACSTFELQGRLDLFPAEVAPSRDSGEPGERAISSSNEGPRAASTPVSDYSPT